MKTAKITVNRSAEQPEGIEIQIVQAETKLEERLLCYLVELYIKDGKRSRSLNLEVPDRFMVEYNSDGSLSMMVRPGKEERALYQLPRPGAVFIVRPVGKRFEVGYAAIDPEKLRRKAPPAKKSGVRRAAPAQASAKAGAGDKPAKTGE